MSPADRLGRIVRGAVLAVVGLAALTAILLRVEPSLASVVLLYLVVVVATAVVGGLTPSLAAAVVSDVVVNFYFVPPYHTLTVEHREQVITLVVYVAVAITVSLAMDLAARQRAAAARTGIEAELLARISAEPVREGSTSALLEHVRSVLHMDTAALVETGPDSAVVAIAGPDLTGPPTLSVPAGDDLRLVVGGPPIFAPDQRFLHRLAAAAGRSLQAERLAAQAAHARELAEVDRLRAALLAAVGHDLRTPLAGIKAGVSSLRDPDLALTEDQQQELLATVDESTDRMDALVENLLAQSRLQAGALSVTVRPVALEEVLLHLPSTVEVEVADDLPLALADPGLLERVVANLVANALRFSSQVLVRGRARGPELDLAVVDHGPGIPPAVRDRAFAAFVGEAGSSGAPVGTTGLGLTIARGFTEAMGGRITATDTPGGGLTVTVTLPVAPSSTGPS